MRDNRSSSVGACVLPCDARERKSGFSLLELIVVLIIISILSSAVVPLFAGSMRSLRHTRAVMDFTGALRFAQERAITDAVEHRFYMDEKTNEYWIMRLEVDLSKLGQQESQAKVEGDARHSNQKPSYTPMADALGGRTSLPSRLTFDMLKTREDSAEQSHFISFYPTGMCDEATVRLREDSEHTIVIRTKGKLGRFDIEEKGGE